MPEKHNYLVHKMQEEIEELRKEIKQYKITLKKIADEPLLHPDTSPFEWQQTAKKALEEFS